MDKKFKYGKKAVIGIVLVLCLIVGGSLLHAHMGAHWGPGFGNPEEHAAMVSAYLAKNARP